MDESNEIPEIETLETEVEKFINGLSYHELFVL